jgi:hypothetical protein
VLNAEVSAVLLGALHCTLKNLGWINKLKRVNWRQNVLIHEVGVLWSLFSVVVLNFGVNTVLWLVINPLSNEKFVFIVVEVRSLAFALVVDPVAFEVVSISLGQHTVAIALGLVPLAFVNVFVSVDHATLALRHAIHPITVVTITVLVEESTTAVLLILEPIASVLASKLFALHAPVGALSVALVKRPHAFVFVSILVVLDAEALFAIVAPVAYVLAGSNPFVTLNAAVFSSLL